jgi:hypothetical protein
VGQKTTIKETGVLQLVITLPPLPYPTFAGYGQYVGAQTACPNAYLVPGLYTGPSYTNGTWTFGPSSAGQYIFTSPLEQTAAQFAYYTSGWNCQLSSSTTCNFPGVNITCAQGSAPSMTPITPPADTYTQKCAVVDGQGLSSGCSLSTAGLKNISGTNWSSGATGVYLPYNSSTNSYGGTSGVGGGLYVEGNATVVLKPGTDGSGNATQQVLITQGSTTTMVTFDRGANTTSIATCANAQCTSTTTSKTLAGVPTNTGNPQAPLTNVATPAMIYVNGTINGLTGPVTTGNSVVSNESAANRAAAAAIQDNYMLTVAASGDVNVTGDLIYKTSPVTLDQHDSLIYPYTNPMNNDGSGGSCANCFQTLGVFTATGSIITSSPYADGNLETDGALAAIGSGCSGSSCGFKVSGSINTWNNIGGQIQMNEFVVNMKTSNTYYDQRFSQWTNMGFAPPWFPSTQTNGANAPAVPVPNTLHTRLSWAWQEMQ